MIRIPKCRISSPCKAPSWDGKSKTSNPSPLGSANRGVPPEKYPFAQDQNLGIWTTLDGSKVAWFKDPDGNILSISQHVA